MSGVEVVGLVLGAFPLIVSAMEHYEDTKKVSTTWWRIKRAHKKDLGRVKDCQLKFRLNLKELLLPLVIEGIVDKGEYELLLVNPGGAGWREDHVEDALQARLAECHERYVEILQEMIVSMARLSKACRVEDVRFQEVLRSRSERAATSTGNASAQSTLMLRANIEFEAKRIKYAFTGDRRDDVLAEIEGYNQRLQDVLAANDRINAIGQTPLRRSRVNKRMLTVWKHARSIYDLLDRVWHCKCKSGGNIWLQQKMLHETGMRVQLRLCHGSRPLLIRISDVPPTLAVGVAKPSGQQTVSFAHQSYTGPYPTLGTPSGSTITITQSSLTTSPSIASTSTVQTDLEADGICSSCDPVNRSVQPGDDIGTVNECDQDYVVSQSPGGFPASNTSLSKLLSNAHPLKTTRVQRYSIALTLASAHLQLHSTRWLNDYWTLEDIRVPTSSTGIVLDEQPYMPTLFNRTASASMKPQKDRTFSTLGIVLLELCFGSRLEDHPLWQNPAYAALQADPMMRHTMACEWAEDVQGEAGDDYATAVNWTLRQAPAVVRDDKWRADFAQYVWQPLSRSYEHLYPQAKGL